jgi:hypothetical protein
MTTNDKIKQLVQATRIIEEVQRMDERTDENSEYMDDLGAALEGLKDARGWLRLLKTLRTQGGLDDDQSRV